MSKLKEIWQIVKRKDYKEGDEVHIVPFNGGFAVSNTLYESLKPKLEAPDTNAKYLGHLYGVRILSTPYLPYIYHEAKKTAKAVEAKDGE